MIDAALSLYTTDDRPPQRILDLGTGSGCILLSLLSEFKEARGVGVDRSPQALQVARINAHRMRLTERSTFIERYTTRSTSSSLP
jgi:release factor glutamine methyltransferase